MQTDYLSLSQATKVIPGNPNVCSVWRWIRRGVKCRNGLRIKLDHRRIGGKMFVTPTGLDDFFRRTAAADQEFYDQQDAQPEPVAKPASPSRRQRRIDQARQQLAEAGI